MMPVNEPELAPIDFEQIDSLVAAAGVDGTREIMSAFIRSSEELLDVIDSQLSDGTDLGEISKTAHALKGSSANVGARQLAQSAYNIEIHCKGDNKTGAMEAAQCARKDFSEFVDSLNAHLDK